MKLQTSFAARCSALGIIECLLSLEVAICDLKFRCPLMNTTAIILAKRIGSKILILRNQRVILDNDLAELYGVPVKRLNEQLKRNPQRFPADFVFTLTGAEYQNLRSQNATSSSAHGGRRYLPHAFTEHGAIMAATVLNSKRAIEMSVFVVRAFVRMRQSMVVNQQVMSKLSELEERLDTHDAEIQELVNAIHELMAPLPARNRQIGFEVPAASTQRSAQIAEGVAERALLSAISQNSPGNSRRRYFSDALPIELHDSRHDGIRTRNLRLKK